MKAQHRITLFIEAVIECDEEQLPLLPEAVTHASQEAGDKLNEVLLAHGFDSVEFRPPPSPSMN